MATVNFYLDKEDKKGLSPIHLRINCNGSQLKISTKQKIKPLDFNKRKQLVKLKAKNAKQINYYLTGLKNRADELLNKSKRKTFTDSEIKSALNKYVENFEQDNHINIVKEQLNLYGKPFTFVDLFAGAGGFSEGFLQAEVNNKFFDFLVANDINDNCELTHIVRYNHQLGLDAGFLCQDITEPDFLDNLLEKIGERKVDVVCGGPPCQSFSLAGKRKKFDKKDDLFSHYLQVIKVLQPKYFVMENVKGILTKEKGKIKELILNEINSIVDIKEVPKLTKFVKELKKSNPLDEFIIDCLIKRIEIEQFSEHAEGSMEQYIKSVETKFRTLTPKIADYKTSKTDERISTIRHGFNMLIRMKEWDKLKRDLIKEKDHCNIDNDYYTQSFTQFISGLAPIEIISKIEEAFKRLNVSQQFAKPCNDILQALLIYTLSFDDVLNYIDKFCDEKHKSKLTKIIEEIRLYKIEAPFVANASNYGVPQNRERVLFIGCRKDQKFISQIPATVDKEEKVSVFEALYDLDFVGNNDEARLYDLVDISKQFNGTAEKMQSLLKNKRSIDGKPIAKGGLTFSEWSRKGRLNGRFKHALPPFYVRNTEALENGEKVYDELHNHKTSNQNDDVIKRLDIIRKEGDYKKAQVKLSACGLSSNKRNYNVLNPAGQSPTVMTIPDDYIHYNSSRALTVREMARLQSFDDSFVFQGKRSTGGNNRKTEVPQYTLVGNAVPPLLARAVAMEILKNIK